MKILMLGILAAILIVSVPGSACANDQDNIFVSLLLVSSIDYLQSIDILFCMNDPVNYPTYEKNRVLGKHPSRADMAAFGVVGLGLTWLISRSDAIPADLRTIILDSIHTSEAYNVSFNENVRRKESRPDIIPFIITVRF